MELIDKSKVVAELEKRIAEGENVAKELPSSAIMGLIQAYKNTLSFLDTLEVKEVDLELNSFDATVCKIGNSYLKEMDRDAIAKALEPYKDGDKVKVIIKAQKGE